MNCSYDVELSFILYDVARTGGRSIRGRNPESIGSVSFFLERHSVFPYPYIRQYRLGIHTFRHDTKKLLAEPVPNGLIISFGATAVLIDVYKVCLYSLIHNLLH